MLSPRTSGGSKSLGSSSVACNWLKTAQPPSRAQPVTWLTLLLHVLLSFCPSVLPSILSSLCLALAHLSKRLWQAEENFLPIEIFHHLLQFDIQVRKQMASSPAVLASGDRSGCFLALAEPLH